MPHWTTDKKKFGLRTYNAQSETVIEKPSYRNAWKERRFGLLIEINLAHCLLMVSEIVRMTEGQHTVHLRECGVLFYTLWTLKTYF